MMLVALDSFNHGRLGKQYIIDRLCTLNSLTFYFNLISVNILFQYPSLESVHDIKAHSTDVDDLDVHPNSNWVSCVLFIFNITFIIITSFRFIYFLLSVLFGFSLLHAPEIQQPMCGD